jgi:hypothetical protein
VHLPQPQKKAVTCFILFIILFMILIYCGFLGVRFVTRGVQKHENKIFKKKHLGSSKKGGFFSSVFFIFFSLGCSVRFFLSRFWGFRNKGSSRENSLSSQKK